MSAVVPRLELRQGQSLVMTQQLQQSIKLLQMSSQELTEFLDQELEKNPLLSIEEEAGEPAAETAEGGENENGDATSENAETSDALESKDDPDTDDRNTPASDKDNWQSEDGDEFSGSNYSAETRSRSQCSNDFDEDGALNTASKVSLREHLLKQFFVNVQYPAMRLVGQHLIDLVDDAGYIKDDLASLTEQLGCDDAMIQAVFAQLHMLDPPGVCARSLPECLAIQLAERDRLDPAMQCLLQNLELVAGGKIAELVKLCSVDAEDVRDMCTEIRTLNPRPGLAFQHDEVQAVIPDVLLKAVRASRWQVELNPAALPRVLVNRTYHAQISARTRDKTEKKYLTDQLAIANWLVKALDQRANTLLKVATEIVLRQDAFLRHGIRYLRPLTLKEVAAATDMHESTVSRITTSKFMMTPRGTFELKYFFTTSVSPTDGGEGYSNKTVQYLIKEIVEAESPLSPLSDDAIAEKLKSQGIEVARRTVAKYRDILRIPSSTQRKRK